MCLGNIVKSCKLLMLVTACNILNYGMFLQRPLEFATACCCLFGCSDLYLFIGHFDFLLCEGKTETVQ